MKTDRRDRKKRFRRRRGAVTLILDLIKQVKQVSAKSPWAAPKDAELNPCGRLRENDTGAYCARKDDHKIKSLVVVPAKAQGCQGKLRLQPMHVQASS